MKDRSSARWRDVAVLSACFVTAVAMSCGGSMAPPVGKEVTVNVSNGGQGVGRVTAPDSAVNIDCLVGPNVPDPGTCSDEFLDAGAGGTFSLVAEANPGSTFAGWSGCSTVDGNECVLSFSSDPADVTFNVTASFDLDPSNECNMAFGTSAGYFLCAETATSCTFYALLNEVDSCTTRCAALQSTCLASIRDTDDTRTQGELGTCDDIVGDRLCECSKP